MTVGQVNTKQERHIPQEVYSCLPMILQDGCSCFHSAADMEAFLIASLPVLSRILPDCSVVLEDKDHRLALMSYIYGGSGMGKSAAENATRMLKHLEDRERHNNEQNEKQYRKACAEDSETAGDPPQLVDVVLPLRTTPSTLLARLERNPAGHTCLLADTEGHALGSPGNKDHGSIRELLLKGAEGERDGQLWKKEGLVTVDVWLSLMVSSTVQHMRDGIKSTEDGLFSRFLWHRVPNGDSIYIDPRPKSKKSRAAQIEDLGPRVTAIYDAVRYTQGIKVVFTDLQYDQHTPNMQHLMDQAVDISVDLKGTIGRLGKRVLRMAAMFAVLRKAEEGKRMPQTVVCDDLSWSAAMLLTEPLFESMMDVYSIFNPAPKAKEGDKPSQRAHQILRREYVMRPNLKPSEGLQVLKDADLPGINLWLKGLSNPNNSVRKMLRNAKKELDNA